MYLLAHTGITLGAAYVLEKAVNYRPAGELPAARPQAAPAARGPLRVDYRFILLGALLPDIIDKPLGLIVLPEVLANGRTFLHSLLFLSLTLLAAFIIYRQGRVMWGIYTAFGVVMHFIMDAIWTDPTTFYWPFLGPFARHPGISAWILQSWLQSLFAEARLYIPEIIGFLILLFFTIRLIKKRSVIAFIKMGCLVIFLAVSLNQRFFA
jgi:inner membrane protein